MRQIYALVIIAFFATNCLAITFEGTQYQPVIVEAPASTGLNAIYVLKNTKGVKASYTTNTSNVVKWYRYSSLGGGYAEEIKDVVYNGRTSTIVLGDSDMGYIIEDGTNRLYYWCVNYSSHYIDLQALREGPDSTCQRIELAFTGKADKIVYYSINGRAMELSRDIELSYSTLQYNEEQEIYDQVNVVAKYPYIGSLVVADASLCNTQYTLTGDIFSRAWGDEQTISTTLIQAVNVEAQTTAEQAVRDNDNEKKNEATGLGGSAPVDISFKAVVTDAVAFTEWQLSKDPSFDIVDIRYSQTDLDYTFRENGTTFVRFVAANASGECEYIGQTYEVAIGESALECPNAFSPGATEGVNDLWKVSYRSLISYECHIFNRWGKCLFSSTDPSIGWDGKVGNKVVPAGVYYYVIKATGADGKSYNRSGDINVVGYSIKSGPGASETVD